MKLADQIYCTFGGGSGGSDTASSTAPIGQHPETDGTVGRNKMRKGGPDKGGVTAQQITDPDTKEFVKETKPTLFSRRTKRASKTKLTSKASLRGTSGGQSEGSSLTKQKFYVVDGQGRVLHTFKTREEAEQASAGNRYTRVVTRIQQSTPLSDTPEVRDMARRRLVSPVTTFRRSLPYPASPFPGSGQGR